jgi:hypothetical protein
VTEIQLKNLTLAINQHELSDQNAARLLEDDESYTNELSENDLDKIEGGGTPILSLIVATGVGSFIGSYASSKSLFDD